jgi:hypothetical protein
MPAPITLRRRFDRKLPRALKAGRQWLRALAGGGRPTTRVVFVVGSQRSGTRLPLQVMDHSPDISTFSEGTSPYFDKVLLQPLDYIAAQLRRSPAPIVVLKPICETHRINELLDRFPGSRAIWIFRHYDAASLSASVKWRSGRENLRRLAVRDFKAASWRAGGLSEEKLGIVKRLYRDDMSLFEAETAMWYLRNGLFFDLRADRRPDVLLVRYEDLISDPQRHFARMFAFIGSPVPASAVDAIKPAAASRRTYPEIHPEIRELCEGMHARMLAHYQSHLNAAAAAPLAEPAGPERALASR